MFCSYPWAVDVQGHGCPRPTEPADTCGSNQNVALISVTKSQTACRAETTIHPRRSRQRRAQLPSNARECALPQSTAPSSLHSAVTYRQRISRVRIRRTETPSLFLVRQRRLQATSKDKVHVRLSQFLIGSRVAAHIQDEVAPDLLILSHARTSLHCRHSLQAPPAASGVTKTSNLPS